MENLFIHIVIFIVKMAIIMPIAIVVITIFAPIRSIMSILLALIFTHIFSVIAEEKVLDFLAYSEFAGLFAIGLGLIIVFSLIYFAIFSAISISYKTWW